MAKKEGHCSDNRKYCCENVSFSHREDYKRLRTNIRFCLSAENPCSVLGVTSAQPKDGKSLTSINLAYSFAQIPDKRVLLIDCDMRRPSISRKLDFSQSPGLSNLISGVEQNNGEARNIYQPSDGSMPFDVLTSGTIPPNPSELLSSDAMKTLLGKLRTAYDFIFLDLPPVGAVTDAQIAASLTDGMLLVVRESYCARPVLDECLRQLALSNAHILGFILNGSVETTRTDYRYKKYSKYGIGYGHGSYGSYGGYGGYGGYGYGYGSYHRNCYGSGNANAGYYGQPASHAAQQSACTASAGQNDPVGALFSNGSEAVHAAAPGKKTESPGKVSGFSRKNSEPPEGSSGFSL